MTIFPGPGEPLALPWQVMDLGDMLRLLEGATPNPVGRPRVVAIDGRSGNGKSTLANRIQQVVTLSTIVHTDDIAWHHGFFDWSDLLVEGVLRPVWGGEAVSYRPPGWQRHGRPGAVTVPAGQRLLIIEGVGASRSVLVPWIDNAVWVQADVREAERRGILRDGGTDEARAFWQEWMDEEVPFLERDQPWQRADLIVAGTPDVPHDAATQVVVAPSPRLGADPH